MRSLTDAFLKNAKDSGYTDMVLRGALGSMYVGESYLVLARFAPEKLYIYRWCGYCA